MSAISPEVLDNVPLGRIDGFPILFVGRFVTQRLAERIRYGKNLPPVTKVALGLLSTGEQVKRKVMAIQHPMDMPLAGPEGMPVSSNNRCREVVRDIDDRRQIVLTDRIQPSEDFGRVSAVKAAVYVREDGDPETDQLVTVFGPHSESSPQSEELLRMFVTDL